MLIEMISLMKIIQIGLISEDIKLPSIAKKYNIKACGIEELSP